jgi:hypothetical protein
VVKYKRLMIVFLHLMGLDMDTKENKQVLKTLKEKGTSVKGDPYKKFFSGGPGALAQHKGTLAQPVKPC